MQIDNFNFKIGSYFSLYVCGESGVGKTSYILEKLNDQEYSYTYVPIQNLKTEKEWNELFQTRNVMSMFSKKKKKKQIIVLDNIDYLQNNDKKILGIISKFLKNIKDKSMLCKKTHTIIFIGNNKTDKKVLEVQEYVDEVFHVSYDVVYKHHDKHMKEIVSDLLNETYDKQKRINSEKTIGSLCFHENIINYIQNDYRIYYEILKNICIGDYYDRIAFQKQLWQFNEMTYYIKVIQNYDLYRTHNLKNSILCKQCNYHDVIFTKILTKYSNEYANGNYIINICNRFNIQKHEFINRFLNNDESIFNKLSSLEKKRITKLLT